LVFFHIMHIFSHEQEGGVENWWLDKTKTKKWFGLAHRVRQSIKRRVNYVR
jgi:hypothetical protein